MRRPRINGFVDRKLKNWVAKDIERPFLSVRDLLFILLLVGYACTSMLPSMIAILVHISLMVFCLCMAIKYFIIFWYWGYEEEYRALMKAKLGIIYNIPN